MHKFLDMSGAPGRVSANWGGQRGRSPPKILKKKFFIGFIDMFNICMHIKI